MVRIGIYRITIDRGESPPTFYFGQSVDCIGRRGQHFRSLRRGDHDNTRMQRSFVKYGEKSFRFDILLECSVEELTDFEQMFVDDAIATAGRRGVLNVMALCVRSHVGVKRTEETRRRMSVAQTGKKKTPEQIEAMRLRATGVLVSDETRRKLSAAHKVRCQHPNSLKALTEARNSPLRLERLRAAKAASAYTHSAETRAKIARSVRALPPRTPEQIEKSVAPLRGRKQTPEAIAKRVASRLANASQKAADRG